jgi:hypothetical protein
MDEELTAHFFNRVFRVRRRRVQAPDGAPGMSGSITLRNKPEFWADAPWRLEPDQDELPVSFHVRDADIQPPGKGPWRLDMLRVEQRLADGSWHKLASLLPADVPDVDEQGFSRRDFWVHGTALPRREFHGVGPGSRVHLRVLFVGSFPPHRKSEQTEIHLETLLAEHPLPKSRAAREPGPPQGRRGLARDLG